MKNKEHDLSTEELLNLCNREEGFRSTLVALLGSETIDHFDAIIESAEEHLHSAMIPFMNDLREIFLDKNVRIVILALLQEELSESQVRGMSYLISSHIDQVQRVELLRARMYRTARETIEQYVPAFDELFRFLTELDREDIWNKVPHPSLTDQFYDEIHDAVTSDSRVSGSFLAKLCRDEQFRDSISSQLESYPEVVQSLSKMATNLVQAQRYLAEIEIEDLLHDIEENPTDDD